MSAYGGYPSPAERPARGWRIILLVQGAYFLVSGVWPLVWMDGFTDITGPKTDLWLVRTVGLLAAVIGATLLLAALRRTYVIEVAFLAVASAFAFLAVDVVGWASGVLRWTYLIDAVAQTGILVGWALLAGARLSRRRGW
jgi:hypothetical protein